MGLSLLEVELSLVRWERIGRAGKMTKHSICTGQLLRSKDKNRRETRRRGKEWNRTDAEEGRGPGSRAATQSCTGCAMHDCEGGHSLRPPWGRTVGGPGSQERGKKEAP